MVKKHDMQRTFSTDGEIIQLFESDPFNGEWIGRKAGSLCQIKNLG
jgi:hypothetical protein